MKNAAGIMKKHGGKDEKRGGKNRQRGKLRGVVNMWRVSAVR